MFYRIDQLLVVEYILGIKYTPLAVFEPFLCGLITTNICVPNRLGHIAEILVVVDVDISIFISQSLHHVTTRYGESHRCVPVVCIIHQMKCNKLMAF